MATMTRMELWPNRTVDDVQAVIRAVYKHVLGNPHMMESERLLAAESQLANGSLSVREVLILSRALFPEVRSLSVHRTELHALFRTCARI